MSPVMDSPLPSIQGPGVDRRADCLAGGGEMGALMRAMDWSATPVGLVTDWPDALRFAVRLCLNSRLPAALWWGRDHQTLFYNDAFQTLMGGTERGRCLGSSSRDLRRDLGDDFGTMIDRILASGEADCAEDRLLIIDRNLPREEVYFTFSYSPITGEAGEVGGVFCSCAETTGRVIAQRRLRALRDLGASLADTETAAEACTSVVKVLAGNWRDVAFCSIYLIDDDDGTAKLAAASGVEVATDLARPLIDLIRFDHIWPLAELGRACRLEVVRDLAGQPGRPQGCHRPEPAEAALVLPIAVPGRKQVAGIMIAGLSPQCVVDDDYRDFLSLAAGQVAAAVASKSASGHARRSRVCHEELLRSESAAVGEFGDESREVSSPPATSADGLEPIERLEFLRHEAELALRESELRFMRFMGNLPGLAWIKDLDGRYVYVNDAAENAFRTRREDLYGRTDNDVFPAEVAAQFRENDRRALASETGIQTIETLEHADGLHYSLVSKFVIRGWDDEAALIGGMAVDITELIRARESTRESEERFRRLAEGIPHLVYVVTADRTVEYLNQRWRDFTGLSDADDASLKEAVHPEDYSLMNERWRDAAARGLPFEAEIRIKRAADGMYRWFLARALPISGPQGAVGKWIGTSTDIDDQKRAEQVEHVLAEAGRLLSASFDAPSTLANFCNLIVPILADWCAVDLVTDDGEVWYREVAHTDPAKVELAREYRRLYPARPDDRVGLMRVFRTGKPEFFANVSDEHLVMGARDHEELRRLRELGLRSVMIVPLVACGRSLGALTMVLAESSRRYGEADLRLALELGSRAALAVENARLFAEAQDAVRRREEALKLHCDMEKQLTLLVEASGSLSASLDICSVSNAILALSRRLVAADAYAVWHYERSTGRWGIAFSSGLSDEYQKATIVVSDHSPFMPEEPIIADNIANSPILEGRTEAYEREGIKALLVVPLTVRGASYGTIAFYYRGEHRFTEVEVRVATALSNLSAAAIGSAQLYEELRTNNRRKDEFLAMLAHELRNPLAAIDTAVSLLGVADPGHDHDHTEWGIDVISRHVKHLTRLLDDLLDVSRITRGMIQLRTKKIDAYAVLLGAIESVRPMITERQHRLATSFGMDLILEADPTRLEQIAANLLSNAAKYTQCGGQIWLTARREQDEIVVVVRDNGVGISAEQLPGVFELFVQGDRSLARSLGGLGIGLTLVQKLTELHGGTVMARSEGPGKGSEFTVRLPAAKAALAEHSRPRPRVGLTAKRPARVLVVDDNEDLARGMARLLEIRGHHVQIAYDGPSGLDKAREWRPEFVLLDIGLPGIDGFQVASLLRQDEDTKCAVIIAVSGYGQEEDRNRSRQAGFDHHLVKPIDSAELLKLLDRAQ
jgi:PAS domain S-box-containing protein